MLATPLSQQISKLVCGFGNTSTRFLLSSAILVSDDFFSDAFEFIACVEVARHHVEQRHREGVVFLEVFDGGAVICEDSFVGVVEEDF
jgi:hypothetical protein